jgi:hypothetical protein
MSLAELEASCQKLEHRRLGNWMARHVSRPMALRVTQVLAPCGMGANAATLCAWLCALVAAVSFAHGKVWSFVVGAVLLQTWYLLDHVDGQLARLRRTESLDGVSLDYLMHHTVNLLLPLGVSHGLFVATFNPLWLWLGVAWAGSLVVLGLIHDVRYKAFFQRLKRVEGDLVLIGGGGGRPQPAPNPPRSPLRLAAWLMAKSCEMHVIMNALALTALLQLLAGDTRLVIGRTLVLLLTINALIVVFRRVHVLFARQSAEHEFASWFRPPEGHSVVFEQGWWRVSPVSTTAPDGSTPPAASPVMPGDAVVTRASQAQSDAAES